MAPQRMRGEALVRKLSKQAVLAWGDAADGGGSILIVRRNERWGLAGCVVCGHEAKGTGALSRSVEGTRRQEVSVQGGLVAVPVELFVGGEFCKPAAAPADVALRDEDAGIGSEARGQRLEAMEAELVAERPGQKHACRKQAAYDSPAQRVKRGGTTPPGDRTRGPSAGWRLPARRHRDAGAPLRRGLRPTQTEAATRCARVPEPNR